MPPRHAPPFDTHLPFVSQQPLAPGAPLHLLPEQQASALAPHAWHWSLAHTVLLRGGLHELPLVTHVPPTAPVQQLVPVHVWPAQHICVLPPQPVHVPKLHTSPLVLQLAPAATHAWSAESQQEPAPVQAPPVRQQGPPVAPQLAHVPLKHTRPPVEHAVSAATHVLLFGSQHEPLLAQGVAPGQHVLPSAPHEEHVPPVQTSVAPASEPAHSWAGAMHVPVESQQAPAVVHAAPPAQQGCVFPPHALHVPPEHTSAGPPVDAQAAAGATHVFVESQHAPVVPHGEAPGQHTSPVAPHVVHEPA
jgi:hypothetical protein